MMGAGCKIVTTTHNSFTTDKPMRGQGLSFEKITIGNDVWFGFNVVVLKGCNIGNGVILAAGCILATKIVENYTVWGAAKKISTRS